MNEQSVLVWMEHDHTHLRQLNLPVITAARACCGHDREIHVLVTGKETPSCVAIAEQAAKVEGVSKVLQVLGATFEGLLAENVTAQIFSLLKDKAYSHVLFPATTHGKNIAPRLAAMLDVAAVTDVIHIIDPNTFDRPIYAGNAIATVQSLEPIQILTLRTTAFDAAKIGDVSAPIESLQAIEAYAQTRLIRYEAAPQDRPELSAAKVVVSGGRALGSAEQFQSVLAPLADKLGAALGASRAAVDAGYAPNDWQVGQTGKVVAPNLYIAVGISGAIQHIAGMKDSKVIVAINKDPDAPIFAIADYGLEADLFEAVPELLQALS